MLHESNIFNMNASHTHTQSKKNCFINQTNKVAKTYLGDYTHHRFGFAHMTNTPQNTSAPLLANTRSTGVLHSSMYSTSQYSIQSPAISLFKRRRSRQRVTTSLPIVVTKPYRGDQQPNDDDNTNEEEIQVFVPLGAKNQPVTVPPIYFTNEHDNTPRRITNKT